MKSECERRCGESNHSVSHAGRTLIVQVRNLSGAIQIDIQGPRRSAYSLRSRESRCGEFLCVSRAIVTSSEANFTRSGLNSNRDSGLIHSSAQNPNNDSLISTSLLITYLQSMTKTHSLFDRRGDPHLTRPSLLQFRQT
jgi:hypothetical protein